MHFEYALSVEFDTHFGNIGNNGYDIHNDHFSLHINGNNITGSYQIGVVNTGVGVGPYTYNEHSQRPINIIDLGNIEDGQWKQFKFKWNASSKTVTVEFDGKEMISYVVDIKKDVMSNDNFAYFGFTADGYNAANEQSVYIKEVCEGSGGESIFKGYTDPNDLDEDGRFDFQQKGDIPTFTDSYEDDDIIIIKERSDTTFTSSVTYDGSGDIVWQMCDDECGSCTTIEESPGLMLTGILGVGCRTIFN